MRDEHLYALRRASERLERAELSLLDIGPRQLAECDQWLREATILVSRTRVDAVSDPAVRSTLESLLQQTARVRSLVNNASRFYAGWLSSASARSAGYSVDGSSAAVRQIRCIEANG